MSIPLLASATELARLVRTGQMSPVELVTATLERIQALNPALNAYVGLDSERALDAARSAEGKALSGEGLGPLHGVPVSIKSATIEIKGDHAYGYTRSEAGTHRLVLFDHAENRACQVEMAVLVEPGHLRGLATGEDHLMSNTELSAPDPVVGVYGVGAIRFE